jgi:hypothetical protein
MKPFKTSYFYIVRMEQNLYNVSELPNTMHPETDLEQLTMEIMGTVPKGTGKQEAAETTPAEVFDGKLAALELHYDTNFTVPELTKISDYYGLKRGKRKADYVESIACFECEPLNDEATKKRRRAWEIVTELSKDESFMKVTNAIGVFTHINQV